MSDLCGVYIHIPFCTTRCNYCHFVTRRWRPESEARYHRALSREIDFVFGGAGGMHRADTIYFGGGTPSLSPPLHIQSILESLRRLLSIDADPEITIEANPGTVDAVKAREYERMGINRISLGVQSFDNAALQAIGRDHSGEDVERSVRILRSNGIANINLDLMVGLPGQTDLDWREDLKCALSLDPSHVSVYMLDLDDHAPIHHLARRGKCRMPEDDLVTDLYLHAISFLRGAGYKHYEISNFARPGFESRHNLKYWQMQPVFGLGVGSHSLDKAGRYANNPDMNGYLEAMEAERSPIRWRMAAEPGRQIQEELFLGLRLMNGIDWDDICGRYGYKICEQYDAALRTAEADGLLERHGSRLSLTQKGILLSNELFVHFVE